MNNGDEDSIDMNSNDITIVDKYSINKGVTDDKGEPIPGEVGQGDITNEKENNIDVPTLEENMGGESDGIHRSNPGTKFPSGTTSRVSGARHTVNNCSTFDIQKIMKKTRRLYRGSL